MIQSQHQVLEKVIVVEQTIMTFLSGGRRGHFTAYPFDAIPDKIKRTNGADVVFSCKVGASITTAGGFH